MAKLKSLHHRQIGLTDEIFERFSKGCKTTWNIVAQDLMEVHGRGEGATREDVIDIVFYGDHLRDHGWRWQRESDATQADWEAFYDTRIIPLLKLRNTVEFKRMMKEIFPLPVYVEPEKPKRKGKK